MYRKYGKEIQTLVAALVLHQTMTNIREDQAWKGIQYRSKGLLVYYCSNLN